MNSNYFQATMNVIDTLAIAPYFLTLFFVEPPEIGPINEELRDGKEDESGFAGIGRIMQVTVSDHM